MYFDILNFKETACVLTIPIGDKVRGEKKSLNIRATVNDFGGDKHGALHLEFYLKENQLLDVKDIPITENVFYKDYSVSRLVDLYSAEISYFVGKLSTNSNFNESFFSIAHGRVLASYYSVPLCVEPRDKLNISESTLQIEASVHFVGGLSSLEMRMYFLSGNTFASCSFPISEVESKSLSAAVLFNRYKEQFFFYLGVINQENLRTNLLKLPNVSEKFSSTHGTDIFDYLRAELSKIVFDSADGSGVSNHREPTSDCTHKSNHNHSHKYTNNQNHRPINKRAQQTPDCSSATVRPLDSVKGCKYLRTPNCSSFPVGFFDHTDPTSVERYNVAVKEAKELIGDRKTTSEHEKNKDITNEKSFTGEEYLNAISALPVRTREVLSSTSLEMYCILALETKKKRQRLGNYKISLTEQEVGNIVHEKYRGVVAKQYISLMCGLLGIHTNM